MQAYIRSLAKYTKGQKDKRNGAYKIREHIGKSLIKGLHEAHGACTNNSGEAVSHFRS
jgi:hypothetical protein